MEGNGVKRRKFKPLGGRISALILAMIVLSSVIIAAFGYVSYRREAIDTRAAYMEMIAREVASQLDGDMISELMRIGERTEYVESVRRLLDQKLRDYGLLYLYVIENYTLDEYRYFAEGGDDPIDFLTVESKDEYGILEPLINQVFITKHSFNSDIYESGEYGYVVSGIAPVIDSRGNVPVIVGADVYAGEVLESTNAFLIELAAATVILCAAFFVISYFYVRSRLSRPLAHIAEEISDLGEGAIDPVFDVKQNDEIGVLAGGFTRTCRAIERLVGELHEMSAEHTGGNTDHMIDAGEFEGIFKEVAVSVNDMVRGYVDESQALIAALSSFADGEFNVDMPRFPGKKVIANAAIDKLRSCLVNVNNELTRLAGAATEGRLNERIDESAFEGDWSKLTRRTNRLLNAIVKPIDESLTVLHDMSEGRLDARAKGEYSGDFAKMKESMNKMAEDVAGYIVEMKDILINIGSNNLNQMITRDYVGQFSEVKNAINTILAVLNDVMRQFNKSANSVANGSVSLAEFSQRLSEGSAEQREVVHRLAGHIASVNEKATKNEEDAQEANEISTQSRDNAEKGNKEMAQMLSAMESIKESSANISKVVKVISDIAFQTNLLAINASVEAAHAGQHGRGFAVVAEQVRTLAVRSQTAARETAQLVGKSIELVNTGSELAERTETALNAIFENISDVSSIIGNIASSSKEQTRAISEISAGLDKIEESVKGVAKDSERCAALSQTLANEATEFKSMIDQFELRKE
jgi:methyl-accepting chemotaxis protein